MDLSADSQGMGMGFSLTKINEEGKQFEAIPILGDGIAIFQYFFNFILEEQSIFKKMIDNSSFSERII